MSPIRMRAACLCFLFSILAYVALITIRPIVALSAQGKEERWVESSEANPLELPADKYSLPNRFDWMQWTMRLYGEDGADSAADYAESYQEFLDEGQSEAEAQKNITTMIVEEDQDEFILGSSGAFVNYVFDWYQKEKDIVFRSEVASAIASDSMKAFIDVDGPRAEVNRLGEEVVAPGGTIGMEMYTEIDANINTVLDNHLFRYGRNIGQKFGDTYPEDSFFDYRQERSFDRSSQWASGMFLNMTTKRSSSFSFLNDVRDYSMMLVRGDAENGYVALAQFIGMACTDELFTIENKIYPDKIRENDEKCQTATRSTLTLLILKPLTNGKTAYKMVSFYEGQFHNDDDNYGFNLKRVRKGLKETVDSAINLKNATKIKSRTNLSKCKLGYELEVGCW